MYPYLKKDLVFTAPKGEAFSAGGSKLLSVVIQWSQNVLDIKAALTWPYLLWKLSHMQKIIIFLQMKFCGAKFSLDLWTLMKIMVLLKPFRFHNKACNVQYAFLYFVEWFAVSYSLLAEFKMVATWKKMVRWTPIVLCWFLMPTFVVVFCLVFKIMCHNQLC